MKTYKYKVQGVDYEVEITDVEGNIATVNVNGIPFEIEMQKPINAAKHPELAATRASAAVVAAAPVAEEPAEKPQTAAPAAPAAAKPQPAAPAGAGTSLKAPLPGTINAINVKVGDTVAVGQVVIVLEAMKMQNNIEAETAGTVTSILVNQGDTVMEGTPLVTIG